MSENPIDHGPDVRASRVREWRKRTTEQAREALQRLVNGCWHYANAQPCFTIPVNEERDADCIVSDVITERDQLERHQADLLRQQQEDRRAILDADECHYSGDIFRWRKKHVATIQRAREEEGK